MKLKIALGRIGNRVFAQIIHQDPGFHTGDVVKLDTNVYIRTMRVASVPDITVGGSTFYIRGTDSRANNNFILVSYPTSGCAHSACEDIVRLWACANGVSLEKIQILTTTSLKSTNVYQDIIINDKTYGDEDDGDMHDEGIIIYSYEEVSQ